MRKMDEGINAQAGDEDENVVVPILFDKAIILKGTLVRNLQRVVNSINQILRLGIPCESKVYKTIDDNVFVIAIEPIEDAVPQERVNIMQNKLNDILKKTLSQGGFIDISVYHEMEVYHQRTFQAEACEPIFKATVSKSLLIDVLFVDTLVRKYTTAIGKTTIDIPEILFE